MSGYEHAPADKAAFMERSEHVIKNLWSEICRTHHEHETLVAVVAPTPTTNHYVEVMLHPVVGGSPVWSSLARLPPSIVEIIDAPHSPGVVKLLYLETDGQMRFLTRPIAETSRELEGRVPIREAQGSSH